MQESRILGAHDSRLLEAHDARTGSSSASLRLLVAAGFRHGRLALTSFLGVLAGVLLVLAFMPSSYQATMKILVRNERVDPVVSSAPNANNQVLAVTDEDLNSEVELLTSEDVLQNVARKTGLIPGQSRMPWGPHTYEQRVAMAVKGLRKALDAGPLPRTNLIEVKFASANPQLAADVLNNLGEFYVEKHLEVRRTSGQYDFFNQQADQYRQAMEAAEAKLGQADSVAPQLARDLTVQKQKDFEATFQQTKAQIAETQHRIQILEQQKADTPARMTTQTRKSDNPALLQNLKSTLLTLELKRTELLMKYQPSYRPVQEVEKQIAETQAAIAAEENAPVREETTDQDPVHLWERSEIAKAQSDLVGLQARAMAMEQTIGAYNRNAQTLEKQSVEQQDLTRTAKTAEENYLLYMNKREEARITDALDRQRMLNIAIAEEAHVPATPVTPAWLRLAMSLGLASLVSIGLVVMAEYFDPTFRTPAEVSRLLAMPVLVSIPSPDTDSRDLDAAETIVHWKMAGRPRDLPAGNDEDDSSLDSGRQPACGE